ncbi:DUF3310 domain-containing protein [uncultured Veillonella sp.]|uniref:DUF3310 domain-containing protein n=1 Tax=uncultured Veillonella sp. TaxID=159268 RepID=UPI002805B68F|nr:DUF3310 domain-containing protein [uncultured Veillonella sp.]
MNTNSKHYEELNIQPWEIMEANFNKEEFIAYLKGNIIKYTLRSKGQDLSDAEKIKHYAEKLIEVQKGRPVLVAVKPEEVAEAPLVESYKFKVGDRVRVVLTDKTGTIIRTPVEGLRDVDEENYIIELDEEYSGWDANKKEHLVDSERAWYVDDTEIELLQETEVKHKFKVGDRVKIDYGWNSKDMKGTIIRTPVEESVQCRYCYIVELDEEENKGWDANIREHLVKSDRAWFVSEEDMELLIKKESKKSLEIGKWYDASTYTVEELKELLPVGTKVLVTDIHDNDRNVELEKEELKEDKVEKVTKRPLTKDTRIGLSEDCWFRRYFKIIK